MLQAHNPPDAINYYIGANVIVSTDVVIAAGAVIEAMSGSRVVVESHVCIGAGTVIQAYGGDLVLSTGVSLGRDVLILGAGKIGQKACVGADSTVINPDIQASQVLPARSLLGDISRASGIGNKQVPQDDQAVANGNGASSLSASSTAAVPSPASTVVYGRDQVMRLVEILCPHRQPLSPNSESP